MVKKQRFFAIFLQKMHYICLMIYLSFHTAAPSFEYYVQLRCQCKNKRKIVGDKKCNSET